MECGKREKERKNQPVKKMSHGESLNARKILTYGKKIGRNKFLKY
jgi:hypothetical protein